VRDSGQELAEMIALGVFHFAVEKYGRYFVGLITYYEIPIILGQFSVKIIIPAYMIKPDYSQIFLSKWIAAARLFNSLPRDNIKEMMNLLPSSYCHCSTRLPGEHIKHQCRSSLTKSSSMSSPSMIILPALGSSAKR
jgi:hypothetical protein